MADFEVRRDDLRSTRITTGETRRDKVDEGEVQLQVDRFALTTNNVTYGALGDMLRYWEFFPTGEQGWGRVPAWGYGDVVASGVDEIDAGDRFYGYFPMSTYVTMRPKAGASGFVDTAEHRSELPGTYNQYERQDPGAAHADEKLILHPLFATGFLLEDFLRANGDFGADAIAVGSASSKTAYSLAFMLARANDGPHVLGLTSEGNREFTESLNLYDRVITYDRITEELGDDDLVYVDMSGDAAVRAAVHETAGERLKYDSAVGITHREDGGDPSGLPGPAPQLFFAPSQIEKLTAELGPGGLQERLSSAWEDFAGQVGAWMDIERGSGPEALETAWLSLADGNASPRTGLILELPD